MRSWRAAQEPGFFGYPDDDWPDYSDVDPEEDVRLARERAQIEARRNAQHEAHVPLKFCACINCREARLDLEALEDLPF